ncbi:hypothetical protein WAK64_10020 [Bacillus spongiae]|uniref:Oligosaccharide flippase family protein n=1 Tax=Bacillus spongiae TaxID=2683610 RepID=A0ABU8HE08_9BACI
MRLRLWLQNIKDYGLNISAFGLYIVMQQLVILPLLSKVSNDSDFSEIVFFISIFNIMCIVFGEELGNTRIVRSNVYKRNNLNGDYHVILLTVIVFISSISLIGNYYIGVMWLDIILYVTIIAFGIVRYFSMAYFKLNQRFHHILFMNLSYGVGAIIGLYFVTIYDFYLAPFLFGEIVSGIYVLYTVLNNKVQQLTLAVTTEFQHTMTTYAQLGGVSIIINAIAYLDRIIIYPMLGATAMVVYFSASAMSKMISLVINPISGVILARLTRVGKDKGEEILSGLVKYLFPSLLLFSIGSITVSYFGVKIFYSNYFSDAIVLIIPIGFATALSLVSFLLKPFLVTYYQTKGILMIHVLYAIVFCFSMYFFSAWWGIIGFAWANVLARLTQLGLYFFMVFAGKSREEVEVASV